MNIDSITLKVEKVWHECGEPFYTMVYSIWAGKTSVGSVEVTEYLSEAWAYIERINVFENFRSMGYGTAALKAISDEFYEIWLAPDNGRAENLYKRLGDKIEGEGYFDTSACCLDQGYGIYSIFSDSLSYGDYLEKKKKRVHAISWHDGEIGGFHLSREVIEDLNLNVFLEDEEEEDWRF